MLDKTGKKWYREIPGEIFMVKEIVVNINRERFDPSLRESGTTEEDVVGKIRSILEGYKGAGAGPQGRFFADANLEIIERNGQKKTPQLSEKERRQLAEQYDSLADQFMERAKTDPSLCESYYNEEGERCPPPISAVGILRQRAQELRAQK